MNKHLLSTPSSITGNHAAPADNSLRIQQLLEEEYAAEIAFLQKQQLQPRPEAIAQLLSIINMGSLEEQH